MAGRSLPRSLVVRGLSVSFFESSEPSNIALERSEPGYIREICRMKRNGLCPAKRGSVIWLPDPFIS